MAENFLEFKENVKNAFSKVKDEINSLKLGLKENNEVLLEITKKLQELDEKIDKIGSGREIEQENKENFFSNGNKGVSVDRRRPSSTTIDSPQTLINDLINDFEQKFRTLTKRELSVFMTIYQLEEESGFSGVTYRDLASNLKISLSTAKEHITSILHKKMPLERRTLMNGTSQFFIKKEFRELAMVKKLLKLGDFDAKLDHFM